MFSRDAKLLLFLNTLFAFSGAVSTVFVNMYLYRYLPDMAALTVFNLFQFGLMPVGFYVAGLFARATNTKWPLATGLALFLGFYALLIILRERCAPLLYLLGTANGLANGFFWFSFNILITDITTDENRGRFFGFQGALGGAMGVLAPVISTAFLLVAPTEEIGYIYLFLSIIGITILMLVAVFMLKVPEYRQVFTVRDKLLPTKDKDWNFSLGINFAYGIRDGANWTIFSILILKASGTDVMAGKLNVILAVVAIAANFLATRFISPRTSKHFWGWGSLAAVVSSVLLVALPTPAMAGISGSLWKVAEAIILLPFNTIYFGILTRYRTIDGNLAGRNIAAETVLNLGRMIGAGAFLILSFFTPWYAEILFPVVTLALPFTFLLYVRYIDSGSGQPAR
jgi:MFS transporter, YQGE family, putative transporter